MTVQERLMATGSWSLQLRPDTPRTILDKITPFSMVAVFPAQAPLAQTDANVLASARYVGIVHQPGPQLSIGGPGLAAWLGQGDIAYDVDGTATLPETRAYGVAALNTWVDNHVLPGTPFTRGTTGPAGNFSGEYQWVTQRDLLEALCAHYGAEWRIRTGLQLDVAGYTTLYGSTPTVVITRNTSGRDIGYTSVQAQVDSTLDVSDYASRVVVLGSGGRGASGGSSSYKGPEGVNVKATRIVDAPDVPAGSEAAAAATYVALFNSLRREVRLSTSHYDVSGDIGVGSLVSLYDPDAGIVDLAATPIAFRGDVIRPVTVRCMGLQWPIRQGMGVALRTNDGGVAWTDLTDYVAWEDGDADIEIGAAQTFVAGDSVSLRADLQPRLAWAPWATYTPTFSAQTTPAAIGNGTTTGAFRRLGTTVEVRATVTMGTTTTFGAGTFTVSLPSGVTGRAGVAYQLCPVLMVDSSTGNGHQGTGYVLGGGGVINIAVATSPWTYADATTPFAWANADSISLSMTLEVDP